MARPAEEAGADMPPPDPHFTGFAHKKLLKMCSHLATDNSNAKVWRPDDTAQPTPKQPGSSQLYRPDILETIEAKIKEMDSELRALSLDIHGKL